MTKIVIAPDKFKGSLSGLEFCAIVEQVIKEHCKNVDIIKCPLADGGDGTIDTLSYHLQGHLEEICVNNPLFRPIKASYLLSADTTTAFIEMSAASGIRLLKPEEQNPAKTSTYGTGELIIDAINKGARHILLGIGGSATNDGGLGMARALGYQLFDKKGIALKGKGSDLALLHKIDASNINPRLKEVKFEIACDVDNPLFGTNGAAYVYATQKGADQKMVEQLDTGLKNYHQIIKQMSGVDLQTIKGAGAAGGLGAGCIAFLNAELKSGIELIKHIANFNEVIKDADWIISGEGKLDQQTLSGKVIKGIIDSISNQKLAVFCGISNLSSSELYDAAIVYIDEISRYAQDVNDSIENARRYLEIATEKFVLAHLV
jgi:glycerate kinase